MNYHISIIRYQVSNFEYQISSIRYQASDTLLLRYPVSDQILSINCQVPDIIHQILNIRYQVSDIKYQILIIRYLIPYKIWHYLRISPYIYRVNQYYAIPKLFRLASFIMSESRNIFPKCFANRNSCQFTQS